VDVSLSAGSYAIRCAMEDEQALTGRTVTLTGTARGSTPSVLPVAEADLIPATNAYAAYVRQALPGLVAATQALADAPHRGAIATARTDWLAAHLDYERLGAAYGAFGYRRAALPGAHDQRARAVTRLAVHRGSHRLRRLRRLVRTQFVEDNWLTGRIGDSSFDTTAGSLDPLFNFRQPQLKTVLLNNDGSIKRIIALPRLPIRFR
jgi:hypothetical protein